VTGAVFVNVTQLLSAFAAATQSGNLDALTRARESSELLTF